MEGLLILFLIAFVLFMIVRMIFALLEYRKTKDKKRFQAKAFFWIGLILIFTNLFNIVIEGDMGGWFMLLVGVVFTIQGISLNKRQQSEAEERKSS